MVLNGDEVMTGIKQGQNFLLDQVTSPAHSSSSISQRSCAVVKNTPWNNASLKRFLNFYGNAEEQTTTTGVLKSSTKLYRCANGKLYCILPKPKATEENV